MFKTKQQVDAHVRKTLSSLKTEKERHLRGLTIAELYFKVGAYEVARQYVSSYLSIQENSRGFKLLGNCLYALGQKEKAFTAYKSSLELEPKQPDLLMKVCEMLVKDEVTLDPGRARYWCEQAEVQFSGNNTVFRLKEKLLEAQNSNPAEVKELILKELEARPTDTFLRIRLIRHLLDQNMVVDAFKHAYNIEFRNLSMFNDNFTWYETVVEVIQRYQFDLDRSQALSWDFWLFNITVLEKQASLNLTETQNARKSLIDCANALEKFDQALNNAAKVINSACPERELAAQFLTHFRGQLCFHIATLLFKRAKKDQNIWKDTVKQSGPLLLLAFHTAPPDLQETWLSHTTEFNRQIVQKWNREGSHRCSQAGRTLLACIKEKRVVFVDRISNQCSGGWREKLFKQLFSNRDHLVKIDNSYFVNSPLLNEPPLRLPGHGELKSYDDISQRLHPGLLHYLVWLGLCSKSLSEIKCAIFDGLQFSSTNLTNCGAETLNRLDMDSFLYCSIVCAQTLHEESYNSGYSSSDKPTLLPAKIMDQLCSVQQAKWWSAAYKIYTSQAGPELGDLRLILTRGIEIVRCVGQHGLDAKLLCTLATAFHERAKITTNITEKTYLEARVHLYYSTAIPLLEKLKDNQAISTTANRMFEYNHVEMTSTEINQLIEEGKLFLAMQLMNDNEHEKALEAFHALKSPYASFYQGEIYKKLAAEQMVSSKENLTSEMRSQHIILLSKCRDCYHLTLDRIKSSVVGKHPLDQILSTHMEEVESQLSRIDPDNCTNRNDNDVMSIDNISSAGSLGEQIQLNVSSSYVGNAFMPVNMNSTPKHKSKNNTPYKSGNPINYEIKRAESRPSPERLDAQIRYLTISRESDMASIMESNKLLLDEIKDMKKSWKKNVQETFDKLDRKVDQKIDELRKEITELKKLKFKPEQTSATTLDEDFGYLLEEELQNSEYNMASINPLYQNFTSRITTPNQSIPFSNPMYPNAMYPFYPYGAHPATLPFTESQQIQEYHRNQVFNQQLYNQAALMQANLSPMTTIYPPARPLDQNLQALYGRPDMGVPPPQIPLPVAPPQIPVPVAPPQIPIQPQPAAQQPVLPPNVQNPSSTLSRSPLLLNQLNSPKNSTSTLAAPSITSVSKPAPVNVVITTSDPLPTTTVTSVQPTLSVTIPPQHIKAPVVPQVTQPQKGVVHNYQIHMPVTVPVTLPSIQFGTPKGTLPTLSSSGFSTSVLQKSTGSTLFETPLSSKTPGLNIFSGSPFSFSKQDDKNSTPQLNKSADSEKSNTSVDHYDALPDFKPIIPLPDEVEVSTGEENETTLFCGRAKLFRYAEKEWRERGLGDIKLLQDKSTKKVRVLMRREQVLKICANHIITSDMRIDKMKDQDKAFVWVANDFADEQVKLENLCVKFKTVEVALAFYDAFVKARDEAVKIEISAHTKDEKEDNAQSTNGFGDRFNTKAGSWNCNDCYTNNDANKSNCVACGAAKDKPVSNLSKTAPKLPSPVKSNVGESVQQKIGGFTFFNTPTFNPNPLAEDNKVKAAEQIKQTPFTGFSFSKPNSESPKQSPFASLNFVKPPDNTPKAQDVKQVEPPKPADTKQNTVPLLSFHKQSVAKDQEFKKAEPPKLTETKPNIFASFSFTPTETVKALDLKPDESAKPIPLNITKSSEPNKEIKRIEPTKATEAKTDVPKPVSNMFEVSSSTPEIKIPTLRMPYIIEPKLMESILNKSDQFKEVIEGDTEDFVPTTEFAPIIPLPELVTVVTGEENETVVYEEHAKLLRHDSKSKQWKEVGTGNMKILQDKSNPQNVRLLMRRDQVHKVCCNHSLTKDIKFTIRPGKVESLSWCAQDYSEKTPKSEAFVLRFKTTELCRNFHKNIIHLQSIQSKTCPKPEATTLETTAESGFGDQFKPQTGSWGCQVCYVSNEADKTSCAACESPKAGAIVSQPTPAATIKAIQSNWGDKFKPKPGNWQCQACYINNDAVNNYCVACDSPKDDTVPKKEPGSLFKENPAQKFSFGIHNVGSVEKPATGFNFGIQKPTPSAGFTFGMPAKPSEPAAIEITAKPTSGFSFGTTKSDTGGFVFGTPKTSQAASVSNSSKTTPSKPAVKFSFDQPTSTGQQGSSGDSAAVGNFAFGSSSTGKFEFVFKPKSPKVKSPIKSPHSGGETEEEYATDEEGDHIYFAPVIPLPDVVEVTTGEENEDVLYSHRAKLFRYVDGEWKERGLGDIKILHNVEERKIRVLMRRDQILKICLNHALTSDLEYRVKDDKTWLFSAHDFSEGLLEHNQFCVRFKTKEIAQDFKDAVDKAKDLLNGNVPLADGAKIITKTDSVSSAAEDSDIEVVYETKVNEGDKELARKYQLPDNFYAYKDLPDCKGCRGCDEDYVFPSDRLKEVDTNLKITDVSETNILETKSPDTMITSTLNSSAVLIKQKPVATSMFDGKSSVTQTAKTVGNDSAAKPTFSLRTPIFGTPSVGTTVKTDNNFGNLFSGTSFGSLPAMGNVFGSAKTAPSSNTGQATPVSGPSIIDVATNKTELEKSTTATQNSTQSNILSSNTTTFSFVDMAAKMIDNTKVAATPTEENKAEEVPFLPADPSLNFASLARADAPKAFVVKDSFTWEGAGARLFASNSATPKGSKAAPGATSTPADGDDEAEDGDTSNVVIEEYDPHYDPIIALPDSVVLTTGEEDEQQLFCERVKLYRFDTSAGTKEWKERGVGELKLLHHPEKNTYRLLLRREQVYKTVLNQLLTPELTLRTLQNSDRALCWGGMNHAEQPPQTEELAARFKYPEQSIAFRVIVEQCVETLKAQTPAVIIEEPDSGSDSCAEEYYEEESEDDEEHATVMFEAKATLSVHGSDSSFTVLGQGHLQMFYDSELFGARIRMISDADGEQLCNTVIGINTSMTLNNNECTWGAVDYILERPEHRTLQASFESPATAIEFYSMYKEGVSYANEADIVDNMPDLDFTPDDD